MARRRRCGSSPSTPTCGTSSALPDTLVHKDEVLRAHCADVGRDPATIERSVGCKITIRGTEAEAERVRRATLEHNRTPLERVADDHTFWTGTPEQIAETMIGYRRIGFHTFIVELPAPYDAETMESLVHARQADGRERPRPGLTSTRRTPGPALLPGSGVSSATMRP